MSQFTDVKTWMTTAQQLNSEPWQIQTANQLSYLCEELREGLAPVLETAMTTMGATDPNVISLRYLVQYLGLGAGALRSRQFDWAVAGTNKVTLLDCAADCAWVANGLMAAMRADGDGAWNEVLRSNNSKFVDGVAQLDSSGKVIKPETYSPPQLGGYLNGNG